MALPMDALKVRVVLRTIPALAKALDEDLLDYAASMIADGDELGAATTEAGIVEHLGPFFEGSGMGDAAIRAAARTIVAGLTAAKLLKPAAAAAAAAAAAPAAAPTSTADLRAALLAGADGAGSAAGGGGPAPVKLASAVKLGELPGGASGGGSGAVQSHLDMLWGREDNPYLKQNNEIVLTDKEVAKAERKAAREARKSESKEKWARSQAEAEAEAERAASAASGLASSGTVTYSIAAGQRKAQDINITGFSIAIGGNVLIENADLRLAQGRRYGLTGRNGYGKTTLLKAMARGEVTGLGSTRFPPNLRVLHVEQEVTGDARSVLDTVLGADVERSALLEEEARLNAVLEGAGAGDDGDVTVGKHADSRTVAAASSTTAGGAASSAAGRARRGVATPLSSPGGGSKDGLEEDEGDDEDGEAAATAASSSRRAGGGGDLSAPNSAAAEARLKVIAARLEAIDAHTAESRASSILSGLGFTAEMQGWPTKALSGGWRMRCALACALFVGPDILLLDEPTNHLDVPAVVWLEEYLNAYDKTLVVVSHDRRFLNAVVTDVIHLHNKSLEYYKGDFDTYERTRAERSRCQEKAVEAQAMKRAHVQSFIDKFRFNAKRASLVQSRLKALERMEVLDEGVADDPRWRFEFPDPGAIGLPVLQVVDVAFGYNPAKPLFSGVEFGIDCDSRVAIVGPNGAGKSTLLKLILGELEPQGGHVARNPKLRTACFTQHHTALLDLTATPLDLLLRLYPGTKPEAVRAHLSSFGLSGELATQKIATLSGGQKSRVSFAVISWKKPHILVLDEPSNHLDIETIDSLIIALGNFQGGVVIVSHDGHLVESVCDEIWMLGHGKVKKLRGEWKDYRKIALSEEAVRKD